MSLLRAFLQAIRERPDDDLPRLVCADWLEESGEGDRAELIRLQIEQARAGERAGAAILGGRRVHVPGPAEPAQDRVAILAKRFAPPNRLGLRSCTFRRGFVERVEVPGHNLERARPVFDRHPVRELVVFRARGQGPALAAFAPPAELESLTLGKSTATT